MTDKQERKIVPKSSVAQRLDQAIALNFSGVSRGQAKKWIALGSVFLDGKRVKVQSRIVSAGQEISLTRLESEQISIMQAAQPTIDIIYEDDDCFVVNKPSGVFSAPTPETDQNDLLHFFKEQQPFLVHRLDRPTSGLLLLAKTKQAAAHFSAALQNRSLKRTYHAIVCGSLPAKMTAAPFLVDFPLKQKEAVSHFKLLERVSATTPIAKMAIQLSTGRTHQIRAHAELLGCPVAGDSKYGRQQSRAVLAALSLQPLRPPQLCLHAAEIRFSTPSGNELALECPWPDSVTLFWEALKGEAAMPRP